MSCDEQWRHPKNLPKHCFCHKTTETALAEKKGDVTPLYLFLGGQFSAANSRLLRTVWFQRPPLQVLSNFLFVIIFKVFLNTADQSMLHQTCMLNRTDLAWTSRSNLWNRTRKVGLTNMSCCTLMQKREAVPGRHRSHKSVKFTGTEPKQVTS